MEEFWKDIDGYEGYYEISNRGEVRKKNKKKPLIRVLNQNGYYQVTLSKKNIRKSYFIHRLFALSFIPNPFNKPFVNHKNGIKTDIGGDNLEWVTPKENDAHAKLNGLKYKHPFGDKHPNCRTSYETIKKIRSEKGIALKEIAKKYNISESYVSMIINNIRRIKL